MKKELFYCDICNAGCTRKDNLQRHMATCHSESVDKAPEVYVCTQCKRSFNRKYHLTRHMDNVHIQVRRYTCEHCGKSFSESSNHDRHVIRCKEQDPHAIKKVLVMESNDDEDTTSTNSNQGDNNNNNNNNDDKVENVEQEQPFLFVVAAGDYIFPQEEEEDEEEEEREEKNASMEEEEKNASMEEEEEKNQESMEEDDEDEDEDEDGVQDILLIQEIRQHPAKERIETPHSARDVLLNFRSLRTLIPSSELNDEVMNAYITALCHSVNGEYLVFQSYFVSNLTKPDYVYNPKYTRRLFYGTEFANYSAPFIFDTHRWIFIPVHYRQHWVLVVVDLKFKCLYHLDSMGGEGRKFMKIVLQFLKDEYNAKKGTDRAEFCTKSWKHYSFRDQVPQQLPQTNDCGAYVCMYVRRWISIVSVRPSLAPQPNEISFTPSDVYRLRMEMIRDLYQGRKPM